MVPGHEAIVGANVFWDRIHSEHDNDLKQLGLGLELLTHWVDARFNYYIPEHDQFSIAGRTKSSTRSRRTAGGILRTTTVNSLNQIETGLEGFNAEIGFLIPGSEQFAETRIYAGYYRYENDFGPNFDGFKGRVETRLLQGVTAGVEYWDDEELMGGHWTAEVAVSVPFEIGKLFAGKNPFEGASESFTRAPRRFEDRLSERIERSHRMQTTTSGEIQTGTTITRRFTPFPQPKRRPAGVPAGGGFPIE